MSFHQQVHQDETDEALLIPERSKWLYSVLEKLRNGYYAQEWVDIIFQKPPQRPIDIYDAAAFAEVWFEITKGGILHRSIPLGGVPFSDSEIEDNKKMLSQLPAPYKAIAEFGQKDQDGFLFWHKPIKIARSEGADAVEEIVIEGGLGAPLEVGSTEGSRTVLHLCEYGSLARWPYEQDYITLLWTNPKRGPKQLTCSKVD